MTKQNINKIIHSLSENTDFNFFLFDLRTENHDLVVDGDRFYIINAFNPNINKNNDVTELIEFIFNVSEIKKEILTFKEAIFKLNEAKEVLFRHNIHIKNI